MKKSRETNFRKREFFKPAKEVYVVLSFAKDEFAVIGVFSKLKLAKLRAVEFISLDFDNEKIT